MPNFRQEFYGAVKNLNLFPFLTFSALILAVSPKKSFKYDMISAFDVNLNPVRNYFWY